MTQTHFDRLEELKRQAAEASGLPIDDVRVSNLASLRHHHEALMAQQVAGKLVNTNDLISTIDAIDRLTPPLKPPPFICEVVEPTDFVCQRCHCVMSAEEAAEARAHIEARWNERTVQPEPVATDDAPTPANMDAGLSDGVVGRAPQRIPVPEKRPSIHYNNSLVKETGNDANGSVCWIGGGSSKINPTY